MRDFSSARRVQWLRQAYGCAGKLRDDTRGAAAIEFALLLPLMTLLFLGAVEMTDALNANRKTTAVASTVADLAAQADALHDAGIADIFGAAQAVLAPFDSAGTEIILSSVSVRPDGMTRVDWSDAFGTALPHAKDAILDVPDDIIMANGSVIVAEVAYPYESPLSYFLIGEVILSDVFYARPRLALTVPRI